MDSETFTALCEELALELDLQIDSMHNDIYGLTEGGYLNHSVHLFLSNNVILLNFNIQVAPTFAVAFKEKLEEKTVDYAVEIKLGFDFFEDINGNYYTGPQARLFYELDIAGVLKRNKKSLINSSVLNWDYDIVDYDSKQDRIWN